MNRRAALQVLMAAVVPVRGAQAGSTVTTVIGTGTPGYGEGRVANPYGVVIGPDGALYFCDLDNQRIRRLDLRTRRTTDIAGSGARGYAGDGGPATRGGAEHAARARVRRATGTSTSPSATTTSCAASTARTGHDLDAGGDRRGRASRATADRRRAAALRQPHSDRRGPARRLLICDIGNHRVRRRRPGQRGDIATFGGTGERQPTPDGAPVAGTPLNGPRTVAFDDRRRRSTWRSARATPSTASTPDTDDPASRGRHRRPGLTRRRWPGAPRDPRPDRRAWRWRAARSSSPTPRTTHPRHRPRTGGSSARCSAPASAATGPSPIPRAVALARPHGVFVDRPRRPLRRRQRGASHPKAELSCMAEDPGVELNPGAVRPHVFAAWTGLVVKA